MNAKHATERLHMLTQRRPTQAGYWVQDQKHSSTSHNLNRPTESPSKWAYRSGQASESDRLSLACAETQTRVKSGSLDGLGPSPWQINDSGQPTKGGPGAQALRDLGVDCRTRAASQESVHSPAHNPTLAPCPWPTNPESCTGLARPAHRITTVQSRAQAWGIPNSPGPHLGSAQGRLSLPPGPPIHPTGSGCAPARTSVTRAHAPSLGHVRSRCTSSDPPQAGQQVEFIHVQTSRDTCNPGDKRISNGISPDPHPTVLLSYTRSRFQARVVLCFYS